MEERLQNYYFQTRLNSWKGDAENKIPDYQKFENQFFQDFERLWKYAKHDLFHVALDAFREFWMIHTGGRDISDWDYQFPFVEKLKAKAMTIPINRDNFFKFTKTIYKRIPDLNKNPDFTSDSGSTYFFGNGGVIRGADHWGRFGTVEWDINNEDYGYIYGFSKWSDFEWIWD